MKRKAKTKLVLAYGLKQAKVMNHLKKKNKHYSPNAKSAKRSPITQTRFIVRCFLTDCLPDDLSLQLLRQ